jgi:hypothetical protein
MWQLNDIGTMAPILIKVTTQGANYKQNHLNGDDAEIWTILYEEVLISP